MHHTKAAGNRKLVLFSWYTSLVIIWKAVVWLLFAIPTELCGYDVYSAYYEHRWHNTRSIQRQSHSTLLSLSTSYFSFPSCLLSTVWPFNSKCISIQNQPSIIRFGAEQKKKKNNKKTNKEISPSTRCWCYNRIHRREINMTNGHRPQYIFTASTVLYGCQTLSALPDWFSERDAPILIIIHKLIILSTIALIVMQSIHKRLIYIIII